MKPIPIQLVNARQTGITSETYILKITGRTGAVIGVTTHDTDITLDGVVYKASLGLTQSNIKSSAANAVDNSEAQILLADSGEFTEQEIQAGAFDFGTYELRAINWMHPEYGSEFVDEGTTGRVSIHEGLAGVVELRSLHQQLKQNFVPLYSHTCRAQAGSKGRNGCFFNFSGLWSSHTVASVSSSDNDRIFTANSAPSAAGPNGALEFVPGIVRFLSGPNAGQVAEVEAVAGSSITLRFTAYKPIQVGDSFEIRPDCAKRFDEDCIARFDNRENFRGEPHIPLTDEASGVTPGANVPRVRNGVLLPELPVEEEV